MRLFGLVVVVLGLLRPVPVHAQTVTLADLLGTWVGGQVDSTGKLMGAKQVLIFRPDSTYLGGSVAGYTGQEKFTRWHHLRGDTLSFRGAVGTIVTPKPADRQLVITSLKAGDGWGSKGTEWIYTREDSLTPKP